MKNITIHKLYKELKKQFIILEGLDKVTMHSENSARAVVGFILIILATPFIIGYIFISLNSIETLRFNSATIIVPFIIIILIIVGLSQFNENLSKKSWNKKKKTYQSIIEYHKDLFQSISIITDIDTILPKIEEAQELLRLTKSIAKRKDRNTERLIQNEIKFILLILEDLRSDLNIRLTEQQSTLKSAKSEVSAHIHGTDELNQVSELQRQRLDKQIEQFEELQRVLVRA